MVSLGNLSLEANPAVKHLVDCLCDIQPGGDPRLLGNDLPFHSSVSRDDAVCSGVSWTNIFSQRALNCLQDIGGKVLN